LQQLADAQIAVGVARPILRAKSMKAEPDFIVYFALTSLRVGKIQLGLGVG